MRPTSSFLTSPTSLRCQTRCRGRIPRWGTALFTFSISHSGHPGELVVDAVQPENAFGKSLRVAAHEFGCARLTVGKQNPIRYNEYDELQVLGRSVDIAEDRYGHPPHRSLLSSLMRIYAGRRRGATLAMDRRQARG